VIAFSSFIKPRPNTVKRTRVERHSSERFDVSRGDNLIFVICFFADQLSMIEGCRYRCAEEPGSISEQE